MRHGRRQGRQETLLVVLLLALTAALCLAALLSGGPNGSQGSGTGGTPSPEGSEPLETLGGVSAMLGTDDLGASSWTSQSHEEGGVEQVATRLLENYRDAADCVLAQAGYLDLMGSVWGCVVYGGTWADVVVVSEQDGGQNCTVSVLRMEADEMAALLEEDGEG